MGPQVPLLSTFSKWGLQSIVAYITYSKIVVISAKHSLDRLQFVVCALRELPWIHTLKILSTLQVWNQMFYFYKGYFYSLE